MREATVQCRIHPSGATGTSLRPCLGPLSSRFERQKHLAHVQVPLAVLGSIGSIRYSAQSVVGVRVIEYFPGP
eukprot:8723449-Alexandrium_andersonii.AAC.1